MSASSAAAVADSPASLAEALSETAQTTDATGQSAYEFIRELYPICRSITGAGLRATLRAIGERIPLQLTEVASGTQVFDWTVPKEWNIRDAYIKNAAGERVVDFRANNLHVVNYSAPVNARMSLAELRPHLFTSPSHPDRIPYRTSYYRETWGFCLSQAQLDALPEGLYEVVVDSTLSDGHLTYGECVLPGTSDREVLIFTHCCHPSICNDNLTGIALATALAQFIAARPHRYTYRFLFAPATIGSITWLAKNESQVGRIEHGLVLSLLGDPAAFTYKKSRRGNALVDRVCEHVLRESFGDVRIRDFSPYGYDERQFCSPGFNLPVGRLTRSSNGEYSEYHSSADNLQLISAAQLAQAFLASIRILATLESCRAFVNQSPKCEPRLGKYGLYGAVGGKGPDDFEYALLWVLNQSDGAANLLDIAQRAAMPYATIARAAAALEKAGLLRPA